MRLLDRYLLRELLVPLGYCLCGFLMLWAAFDLCLSLGDFQKRGMTAGDLAQYYLVLTPGILVIVLPVALLLSLLYCLTNHARHNEITAIRAAGVGVWRLSVPYLLVGLVGSLVLLAINELWAPDSMEKAEVIKERHLPNVFHTAGKTDVHNLCFDNTRDGRIWRIGVYNSLTGEMHEPIVSWTGHGGARPWQLRADRAALVNGVWTFYNVREFRETPQSDLPPVPSLQTNVLALPELTETIEEINSEISISSSLSVHAARRADVPILELLHYLRLHPHPGRTDACWLYTKLEGRLASPWTCLVVVVIAIPFGAAAGRRNVYVGVASSIVICFVYFILLQVGLALGTSGALPPWLAAWFPNLSFGLAGLWMTARVP
ncbi:MAG TPA: LptF/LptG family permease [Candidatus Acidoferrum sp.]|nr:LptF/LptG family permease [Candidatus Acidoferrum sp.]